MVVNCRYYKCSKQKEVAFDEGCRLIYMLAILDYIMIGYVATLSHGFICATTTLKNCFIL